MSKPKAARERASASRQDRGEAVSTDLSPRFVVVIQVDQKKPDAEFFGGETPPAFVEQCEDGIQELLLNDSDVRNDLSTLPGQWVVLGVQSHGDQTDRGVDLNLLAVALKKVLLRAIVSRMDGHRPGSAEGVVWEERGSKARQLRAHVVVLDDREAALRCGERMASGDDAGELAAIGRMIESAAEGWRASDRDFRERLIRLSDANRIIYAKLFEPVLNREARARPHETYDQKRDLAKWVNSELRQLGLAIKSPQTGEPCLLRANATGVEGVGRFMLDYTDSRGKRHYPITSVTLPPLTLIPDRLSVPRAPSRGRD